MKLAPRPLTAERESPATFLRHNALIEEQRRGRPPGRLVAGVKKDVVVSSRLAEPGRVAIHGRHAADGKPIQPPTTVHRDAYVDYSHGVRMVRRTIGVGGRPRDVRPVQDGAGSWRLHSDEGRITRPTY